MRYGGWFQVAFERDLTAELSTVRVGKLKLLCVRRVDGWEVYDAVCPHRGADLSVGSTLRDSAVICGYHGHKIALGGEGGGGFCVRRYPSLAVGGLIFALVGTLDQGPLPAVLAKLVETHHIFPGFQKSMRVPPELVIENAFDAQHFRPVHSVIKVIPGRHWEEEGMIASDLTLRVGPSAWQGGSSGDDDTYIDVPFFARAFSPNVLITQIAMGGGDHPHYVIATATPQADGTSTVRLSIAMEREADGSAPSADVANMILGYENFGIEQDRPIWENMADDMIPSYTPQDAAVVAYRQFCERFRLGGEGLMRD